MLEYVPTAPLSFITATDSRAARRRVRSRSTWAAHSATLAPNVVGSAWMPCVRPIITVSRWVRASATSVRSSSDRRVDQQVGRVGHRPAQRRVDDVGRRQAVVDPRTGRLADRRLDDIDERRDVVIGDRLAFEHRLDERLVDDRARAHGSAAASALGTTPSAAWPSVASSSTSSQRAKRAFVGPHRVHLGRGVARDHDAHTR